MEITKVKDKRFIRMYKGIDYSKRCGLDSNKNKPLIKDDTTTLYKVFQKTAFTFNKEEIKKIFDAYGKSNGNRQDHTMYHLDAWDFVNYLRETYNSKVYYDNSVSEETWRQYKSEIHPKDLPEDYTFTVKLIMLDEDAQIITKRTDKEKALIDKVIDNKNNLKIFKHFIKPVIQPICNKYGIEVTDHCLYFQDREKLVNFLKTALNEIIVKQFEDAGVTVPVQNEIGNPRSRELWPRETIFKAVDFRIMKEGDMNKENLG